MSWFRRRRSERKKHHTGVGELLTFEAEARFDEKGQIVDMRQLDPQRGGRQPPPGVETSQQNWYPHGMSPQWPPQVQPPPIVQTPYGLYGLSALAGPYAFYAPLPQGSLPPMAAPPERPDPPKPPHQPSPEPSPAPAPAPPPPTAPAVPSQDAPQHFPGRQAPEQPATERGPTAPAQSPAPTHAAAPGSSSGSHRRPPAPQRQARARHGRRRTNSGLRLRAAASAGAVLGWVSRAHHSRVATLIATSAAGLGVGFALGNPAVGLAVGSGAGSLARLAAVTFRARRVPRPQHAQGTAQVSRRANARHRIRNAFRRSAGEHSAERGGGQGLGKRRQRGDEQSVTPSYGSFWRKEAGKILALQVFGGSTVAAGSALLGPVGLGMGYIAAVPMIATVNAFIERVANRVTQEREARNQVRYDATVGAILTLNQRFEESGLRGLSKEDIRALGDARDGNRTEAVGKLLHRAGPALKVGERERAARGPSGPSQEAINPPTR